MDHLLIFLSSWTSAVQIYPFRFEHGADVSEEGSIGDQFLVDEKRLHGVTSRRIIALGITNYKFNQFNEIVLPIMI